MNKKVSLLSIIYCLISFGCNFQNNSSDFTAEIENWKLELQFNGDVGPPCADEYNKWATDHPNYYWGLQEIHSLKSDFNADGIKDVLFYFPAVSCVGGNGNGSDFAMLVYSKNGQFLTNKYIATIIEDKIQNALGGLDTYNVNNIVIRYNSFAKNIGGNYLAWVWEDAHCCPSSSGSFEYNPMDFSIIIKNKKEKYKLDN